MVDPKASSLDKALAGVCANCPICRRARWRQTGAAFWLVKRVETKSCPFCRAYERVHGRKAHERITPKD
jgi:lipoate synthase